MHADLNPCGGSEQVALATLQALIEMGLIDVELALVRNPIFLDSKAHLVTRG